jgi:membrane protease YdiL (CAAX protease family)
LTDDPGAPTGDGPRPAAATDTTSEDPAATAPPARPGLGTFTIEGRAAPGLFVVGWLATVLGLGSVLVAVLAGSAPVVLIVGLVLLSVGLVAGAGAQAIERRADGRRPYTGPSPLLVFAATVPVAYLAAIVVGAILSAVGVEAPRAAADLLIIAIQAAVNVGLVALLVVGTGALSWRAMGLRGETRRALGDLAWGAVLAGPVIGLTLIVTSVLVVVFGAAPESPLPPTGELSGLLIHLAAGAVIAPISEEVLFRGVATTAWVRAHGVWPGILRAAVFFALVHVLLLAGSTVTEAAAVAIVGFAGRLPVAIALGWVFVRRDSLWAAIGLHGAFNGVLLVLADIAVRSGAVPA